jgi:hypothetical protein
MERQQEIKVTFTSHRFWRIIFPIIILILLFEYGYLFFVAWPASENLARTAGRLGSNVVASINRNMVALAGK